MMIDGHSMRKIAGSLIAFVGLVTICPQATQGVQQSASATKPPPRAPAGSKKSGAIFVSDDKRFSLWMPKTPAREDINVPSPFGTVVCIRLSATDQKAEYSLGYTDYPADKFARMSPDKFMQMAADALHKKFGKGVIKDEKISYLGYRGRDLICRTDVPAKVEADMRFFLVKNRMYTVGVEHLQSTEMKAETSQFMDSLKLLK